MIKRREFVLKVPYWTGLWKVPFTKRVVKKMYDISWDRYLYDTQVELYLRFYFPFRTYGVPAYNRFGLVAWYWNPTEDQPKQYSERVTDYRVEVSK